MKPLEYTFWDSFIQNEWKANKVKAEMFPIESNSSEKLYQNQTGLLTNMKMTDVLKTIYIEKMFF